MNHIPRQIPAGLESYKRTPEFTPDNLPSALRSSHSTKPGVWGLLQVLEGQVTYHLAPPHTASAQANAGDSIVILPEIEHWVEFSIPGRFYVEFYRPIPDAGFNFSSSM
ncbi:DUF1971 domain-containing protein [Methylobacillus gramineus]|uniref:DUF1971 domain-containing protein n=1 Tax=Methylobacillus gramineus TaxID=755169 RepID=UPI001CFFA904|nr:DUF1971 domain-containing protein [Methylobacillus gramineus]MCB5185267.1 DUF1971 domain-containing protein [Methylobacillus gramineus]